MATPEDFLAQASKLLKTAGTDIEYRSVVESAYYGAFHAARGFEEKLPHRSQAVTDRAGSHETLFQCLERPNPKLDYGLAIIGKDIAAQMRQLKALRELAAYELEEEIRVDQAEAAIAGAKEVLAESGKGLKKIPSR